MGAFAIVTAEVDDFELDDILVIAGKSLLEVEGSMHFLLQPHLFEALLELSPPVVTLGSQRPNSSQVLADLDEEGVRVCDEGDGEVG